MVDRRALRGPLCIFWSSFINSQNHAFAGLILAFSSRTFYSGYRALTRWRSRCAAERFCIIVLPDDPPSPTSSRNSTMSCQKEDES